MTSRPPFHRPPCQPRNSLSEKVNPADQHSQPLAPWPAASLWTPLPLIGSPATERGEDHGIIPMRSISHPINPIAESLLSRSPQARALPALTGRSSLQNRPAFLNTGGFLLITLVGWLLLTRCTAVPSGVPLQDFSFLKKTPGRTFHGPVACRCCIFHPGRCRLASKLVLCSSPA